MEPQKSPLEIVFETLCRNSGLTKVTSSSCRIAQGPLFLLELEEEGLTTRLLYVDRVAAADFYDCKDQKYLSYSVRSVYDAGQTAFLQDQNLELARKVAKKIGSGRRETHRTVVEVDLDNFSEVDKFLTAHINNY